MPARGRLPLLALAAFWAATYLPPLVADRWLPARDAAATQVPWRTVWREQVAAGHLPLWDPYSNQGRPLLANPNAMALYPGTVLFLLLPPERAAAWHVALHHLLLLAACYLLARRAGALPGASAVGAAAAGSAGIAFSLTTFLNSQASLAWATIALAAALPPPRREAAAPRALAAGAFLGIAFLAGEPVVAALGATALALVMSVTWGTLARAAVPLAAAAAIGTSAPVLLSLLAVYPDTLRATLGVAPGALAADTLAPRRWLELLFPRLLGPPLGDVTSGFWAAPSFPWQRYFPAVFVGLVPLLTVPLARRGAPRLWPWWALLAAGAGGSALLAWPGAAAAAASLPGAGSVRFGIKLLLLAFLALPVLVARGHERLAALPARRRRAIAGTALVLAAVAAATGALAPRSLRAALARLYPRSAGALAAVSDGALARALAADAAALALPAATLLATASAAPLCAAVLAGNAIGGAAALSFEPARRWAATPELAAAAGAGATVAAFSGAGAPSVVPVAPALARYWRFRAALTPEYGTRWGLAYVLARGPDGLEPLLQEGLAAEVRRLAPAARARAARALGASALIDDAAIPGFAAREVDGVWLTRLADDPPAAYLARRELPCAGIPAAVQALAGEGFVPAADAAVEGTGGAAALGGGTLAELAGAPHRRRFRAVLDAPGLLVVRQSSMRCWRARIDGRASRVEVVNGAQLGVRVPAGAHLVELLVDARPAWLGMAGPLLVAAAWTISRRRAAASPARRGATGGGGRSNPATPPAR